VVVVVAVVVVVGGSVAGGWRGGGGVATSAEGLGLTKMLRKECFTAAGTAVVVQTGKGGEIG